MDYQKLTKEMWDLGYDFKGCRFVTKKDTLVSFYHCQLEVVRVYVRNNCPLSIRYFQSNDLWKEVWTNYTETCFEL